MSFERVKDVVLRIENMHRSAADLFREHADRAGEERQGLFLQTVAAHEDRLRQGLRRWRENAPPRVLNAWFQFTPARRVPAELKRLRDGEDVSSEEAVELAMGFNTHVEAFYRRLRDESSLPDLAETFNAMLGNRQETRTVMSRRAEALHDL